MIKSKYEWVSVCDCLIVGRNDGRDDQLNRRNSPETTNQSDADDDDNISNDVAGQGLVIIIIIKVVPLRDCLRRY